jgi:hypothetical protein
MHLFGHTAFICSNEVAHRIVVLYRRDDVIVSCHVTAPHAEFEKAVDAILDDKWRSVTFTVEDPLDDPYRGGPHLFQLDAWAKRLLQRKALQMKRGYALKKFLLTRQQSPASLESRTKST